jgi:hypothetical protein
MNFARRAALAAMVTALSAVCATARPIATAGDTNLRNAPGTDKEILTLIPKGTTVEVGRCSNGWCQVSWNGQDGYSIARNLGMAPPAPRPPSAPAAAAAAPENAVSNAPTNAYGGMRGGTGTRYLGAYNERFITQPDGTIAGTDPDPNIRAYLRRDGAGANGAGNSLNPGR